MTFRPHRSVTFSSQDSVPLEAYKEIEARQDEFFGFLDSELEKNDGFYREKEEAATARLAVLREQLHIMRDRRAEEIARASHGVDDSQNNKHNDTNAKEQSTSNGHSKDHTWLGTFDKAVDKAKLGHVGKTFKAMKDLGTPSGPSAVDLYKDYTRKPFSHEVAYRTAKHKLKVALAEYYRGLELLKSYSLLNRTAFRKIVKKYDKTVQTQPTGRYMSERVNKAHFVNSEIIEGHIHAVEDLYSRYFERGNRKLAVGKLRAKIARAGEFSQASFINGLMLAAGLAFGIEGMVYGIELLSSPDELKTLQTTYLLQLYGGFFLAILMGLFFCLACRVWHKSKVNYTFVFEFDTRRQILDWRQLSEVCCHVPRDTMITDNLIDSLSVILRARPYSVAELSTIWRRLHVRLVASRPRCNDTGHHAAPAPDIVPQEPTMVCLFTVALVLCGHLPCRVPRLLHGRPLLLRDLCRGQYRNVLLHLRTKSTVEPPNQLQLFELSLVGLLHYTSRYMACAAVCTTLPRYEERFSPSRQWWQILLYNSLLHDPQSLSDRQWHSDKGNFHPGRHNPWTVHQRVGSCNGLEFARPIRQEQALTTDVGIQESVGVLRSHGD